ncbi:MAG: transcription-repair coupling factor [Bdellovibrionales bacterium]
MAIDLKAFNPDAPGVLPIYGAPPGHDARTIITLALQAGARGTVAVVQDDLQAAALVEQLQFFAPELTVHILPAWDCLPYDRVSPSSDVLAERAQTLTALTQPAKSAFVVVTTVAALMQLVPPPEAFKDQTSALRAGQAVDRSKLQESLVAQGYRRTTTVREAGEYSFRGDVIDIFPAGADQPVRLDLFGDEVENLRTFDAATQLSADKVESLNLQPVTELMLTTDRISSFRTRYRELFGAQLQEDPLYQAVSEGRAYAGVEHWLPLFYEQLVPITAYLPRATFVMGWQTGEAITARWNQITDFYNAREMLWKGAKRDRAAVYKPVPPALLYTQADIAAHPVVQLSPFAPPSHEVDAGGRTGVDFAAERQQDAHTLYDKVLTRIKTAAMPVIIAVGSDGAADRLQHVFDEHGGLPKNARLAVLPLEQGFTSNDLTVITEQDILGDRLVRPRRARKRSDEFIVDLGALNVGDLIVHEEHGIGRYDGLVTLDVGGTPHDCLKLVYAGGDRIFVPVENLELLSRYGNEETGAQLDKLGGAGWQQRKARVKKRLRDMADALLKIAAMRELQEAPVLTTPINIYDEFAARFPYVETEDQSRAIENVIEDLGRGKPMDRLVCGDVGFGKTEVALRAAFVAASAGLQVAVVVPTTLLARQHARNFKTRFQGLPIKIGQMSRFVSAKEAKQNKEDLENGRLDIVIGTHAILAQSIKFARLGLVIVDEEQHFGVKQKEKLKDLQKNVHVLTLSATPIPRTLQLALTGVRELSLIATPPVDRLAVRTTVLPYDPLIIREALMREHFRGGQSFYVAPRVQDLGALAEELNTLVPELKIRTAHGQMPATELEDIMAAFDDGAFEVLLSTNIVESGLDIPRANTIIIHRADMFGLAQLYQLRGRVGRAKQRGYAYLTHAANMPLTDSAEQRLKVMETLDQLGAGFQLASHDLDLRGAGNLLGEEQSGHVREVGIELYQQMLREAVAAARRGELVDMPVEDWTPTLNLGLPVLIPESYVADLGLRLTLYRRLADIKDEAGIEAFAAELVDRFGKMPREVENLLATMHIKLLCKRSGIEKLDVGANGALITFRKNTFAKPDALIAHIQYSNGKLQIRPDMKLSVLGAWNSVEQRLTGARAALTKIAEIAA